MGEVVRGWIGLACVLILVAPASVRAEQHQSSEDAWTFHEAWRVFRADLDASVPGEHGGEMLIEHLEPGPPWLVREAIRVSRSPWVISRLTHRAVHAGDAAAVPALHQALAGVGDERTRQVLERALVRLGDAAIREQLAARLERGSTVERWRAATTLAAAGVKATPVLRAAMSNDDEQTRLAAASALVSLGDVQAKRTLGELLTSANPYQQLEAAHALALAGDARAVPVLRERLETPGSDRRRLARSLGFVGKAPERELLLGAHGALPPGRSQALRLDLLRALGRITTRVELSDLESAFATLDEDEGDDAGVPGAWFEEIGRAVAGGAKGREPVARAVQEALRSPLARETPVALEIRRERVQPLVTFLTTGKLPPRPVAAPTSASVEVLLRRLRDRGGDADDRLERFGAALTLLERLGERLGYPALSEPPAVRAVGLGAERAVDGNVLTAWVAGELAGTLRLDLRRPVHARSLLLIAGCVDSRASYRRHGRIRRLRLRLDGVRTVEGQLRDDDPWFQRVELPGTEISQVVVEVLEVYPGERRDAPACIAEIRLQ